MKAPGRQDIWRYHAKRSDPFRFHPRVHELEERRMLSAQAGLAPGNASSAIPAMVSEGIGSIASAAPAAGAAGSNSDNSTAVPSAVITTPNNSTPTATVASQTTDSTGQTAVIQAAISLTPNISSAGFATPLPATVGVFATQQGPAAPTAAPGSLIPPQPSQFVAPPNAPLTGGDVALASPKGNLPPPPSQNPSDSMLNDDMIAQENSAEDALTGAATDIAFQTLNDAPATGEAVGRAFAQAVDKLAVVGLPLMESSLESNALSQPAPYGVSGGLHNPLDKSPAPDLALSVQLDEAQFDWRSTPTGWAQVGAVAACAGAGLWADRAPSENRRGARQGRRLRVDRRPRW